MRLTGLAGYTELTVLDQLGETIVLRAKAGHGGAVIIKTHATDLPTSDHRDRFRREHQLTSRAQCDTIVEVASLVDESNRAALILVDTGPVTLAQKLAQGPVELIELLDIAIDIARALTSLHAAGVVHRAVDADHIAVTPNGGVLVDFYDACLVGARPRRETHGHHPSPEQLAAVPPPALAANDQYGLAATLSHALATLDLSAPPGLAAVLARATSADPRQRYRSLLGMLADLDTVRVSLAATGTCEKFDLAVQCPTLMWEDPTELVGRSGILAELHEHIDSAAENDAARVIVLRSAPGVGRSSVLARLGDELAEQAVLSGVGRCSDGGPTLPLQAPLEMMEQAIALLLAAPDEVVNRVRSELVSSVGSDLALAVQVIPALGRLVDEQTEPPGPPPDEMVSRVEQAVAHVIEALTRCLPPLVTIFDDGDRADVTSLRVFEFLAGREGIGPLVVVIASALRSRRLDPILRRLRSSGVAVHELILDPLDRDSVCDLVAAGTGSDPHHIAPLAEAVLARSGGSPTLALADLWHLTATGDLKVDIASARWVWTDAALEHDGPLTVDAVATRRIEALDDRLHDLVIATAVAGRSTSIELLAAWRAEPVHTVAHVVDRGIAARVLQRHADAHGERIACTDNGIRRAALGRLSEADHVAIRYSLAQAMISILPVDESGTLEAGREQLFTLIELLKGQPSLRTDDRDRRIFIQMCQAGARLAHHNAAFHEALDLQREAIDVVTADDWSRDPDGMFTLHLHAAAHAVMIGNPSLVDELIDRMQLQQRPALERVRAMRILGTRAWAVGDLGGGLDHMRNLLAELGEPIPAEVSWPDIIREYAATRKALGTSSPESFLDAPRLIDRRVRAALDAMIASVHLAYVDQPLTHLWLVLRGTRLTAQHGVSDASAYFLTAYGMLSLSTPRGIRTGLRFGKVGRELGTRSENSVTTMVVFAHEAFVRHWGEPLADTVDPLLERYRSSVRTRQREHGLAGGTFAVLHALLASRPLRWVENEATSCAATFEELGERVNQLRVEIVLQAVHDLRTGPSNRAMAGPHFDADAWLAAKPRRGELATIVHTLRGLVAACHGDLDTLGEATDAAGGLVRAAPGQAVLGRHWFHVALLDAERLGRTRGAAARAAARARGERSLQRLRNLAAHAPGNAGHQVVLIEAIMAEHRSSAGGQARAMERFEQAVSLATSHGALHDVGLSAERAARFHAEHDRLALARHYANIARDAWESWGAIALTESISQRLPDSVMLRSGPARTGDPDGTKPDEPSTIDLTSETLAEASSLLGQELEVREFLERLIDILMRHTDATRGFLVLQSLGGPVVEVAGERVDGDIRVVEGAATEFHQHPDLCGPAVNFVLRTREALSVIDPATDRRLRSDPKLRARSPRALLALPVGRTTATSGVLVLESDTYSHAFESERIEALRVLSAQAISAVDQARLSSDLSLLSDDVAQLRATASELTERAETDALTGVANRAGMEARLHAAIRAAHGAGIENASTPGAQVGVLFCDLDDFKLINDHYGHGVGDTVLAEIAARLRSATRNDDIVARVGGDEFVVVCVGVSPDELERMAERALREIAAGIEVAPHGLIKASISIGVGRTDLGEVTSIDDVDALMRAADTAMYRAKHEGKNQVHEGID